MADKKTLERQARERDKFHAQVDNLRSDESRKPVAMPTRHHNPARLAIRRAPPTVAAMLDNAYQALAMQLHQWRADAHRSKWTSQEASSFGRLVGALVSLQDSEKRNSENLDLSELSDSELSRLGDTARKFLKPPGHD